MDNTGLFSNILPLDVLRSRSLEIQNLFRGLPLTKAQNESVESLIGKCLLRVVDSSYEEKMLKRKHVRQLVEDTPSIGELFSTFVVKTRLVRSNSTFLLAGEPYNLPASSFPFLVDHPGDKENTVDYAYRMARYNLARLNTLDLLFKFFTRIVGEQIGFFEVGKVTLCVDTTYARSELLKWAVLSGNPVYVKEAGMISALSSCHAETGLSWSIAQYLEVDGSHLGVTWKKDTDAFAADIKLHYDKLVAQ